MSRTKNAKRNIISGIINKLIHLFFPFIIRSVLIQKLGAEYLGLGSLFTSILQVLSIAELGFSSAITYNMYKPIADKDTKSINALLNLYKKIYRIVGLIILVIGLALLPFLHLLIKGAVPENISIYTLYIIYLFGTVATYYLFAYKSALINALQRSDIINNIRTITSLLQYILQIITLIVFRDFYVYVIIQCITQIIDNILVAIIAKHKYPEFKCAGVVTQKQKKDIRKKVTGLMIQRVCSTTRNSLDSVFISSMVGLTMVAMYSNYYTIMTAIIGVLGIVTSSIVAGVGNSIATESVEKNHNDMNKFNFIYMLISGWITIFLACLYQPVMRLWVGEELLLPYGVVVLFCLYFYALKMGDVRSVYVEAKGLWYESRYRSIAESVLNIVLNLVLGHLFGIYGIIAGTLISLLLINFGYGSTIIYEHYFKEQKVSRYFLSHFAMAFVTMVIGIIAFWVCSFVSVENILIEIILKSIICLIIPAILYLLVYYRTNKFKEAKKFIKKMIKRGK